MSRPSKSLARRLLDLVRGRAVRRRARTPHARWEAELGSETGFWEQWLATRGSEWPDDFARRLDPHAPLTHGLVLEAIELVGGDTVRILDVGAGPMTVLGKTHPRAILEIVAVDPLADRYDTLLSRYIVDPPIRTMTCDGERLVERFAPGTFDIAFARNALDHSYDPALIIKHMVSVVRPGGAVVLEHFRNEAVQQSYVGLHRWNFDVEDGALVLWNQDARRNLSSELGLRATIDVRYDDTTLECLIRRREPDR